MHLIKINLDAIGTDNSRLLTELIKKLQRTIHIPLIIEGSNLVAIETALRVYNGKPIVKLLHADPEGLEQAGQFFSKYGASFWD